ncbi:endoribonuclease YbeY [Holospora obtusa F1]|uniref:Endoribonuclease YbeY n=1 Tax=Holospora obtusa F1 TaxID=1399147 RepID=W6TFP1_HOLOB|nr:endoribonuclease YbeY [Holospora obtusa F1]
MLLIGIVALTGLDLSLRFSFDSQRNFVFEYPFIDRIFVKTVLNATLLNAGHAARFDLFLEVLLIHDKEMEHYTQHYGPEPGPTNVLSFPLLSLDQILNFSMDIPLPLGTVLLGFPYITKEIQKYHFDPQAYIARLLIHGILHLLGYDHVKVKEREVMEALEKNVCTHLGYDWRPL